MLGNVFSSSILNCALILTESLRRCKKDPDEIYFDPASSAQKTEGAKVYHYVKRGLWSGDFSPHPLVTIVKVVVEINTVPNGYISTMYFSSHFKKGLVREWKK